MTEQNQNQEQEVQEESPQASESEVTEVEWQHIEPLLEFRQEFFNAQARLSSMLLEFERRKSNFLSHLQDLEETMYQKAQDLQEQHNLNPDWTYELKFPTEIGEKGYFIRKQD